MANEIRTLVAAAVAAISLSSGAHTLAAEELTIVLRVIDYTHMPSSALASAEDEATRIYHAAGIVTIWENRGTNASAPATVRMLDVILLNQDMADQKIHTDRVGGTVLGQASREAGRAYIFCHRILMVSEDRGANFRIVLGRILAHETGHLLLPTHSHSAAGIMRVNVDLSNTPQRFNPEQVGNIQATITADRVAHRSMDGSR